MPRSAAKTPPRARLTIAIRNEQSAVKLDRPRLRAAIRLVLADADISAGEISVAIVDDAAIHKLNRRYLQHDEPTDVITFPLERVGKRLEGEIVASGETAARVAARYDWSPTTELLLYVIHGALHLAGCDDRTSAGRAEMRKRERHYLASLGIHQAAQHE